MHDHPTIAAHHRCAPSLYHLRAQWPVGSFVCCGGKQGKIVMAPDGVVAAAVKLEWASGGTSNYINYDRLTQSNERDFEREQVCVYTITL